MATKSFTTDMKFSKKSVNKLIEALDNNKNPNINTSIKVDFVTSLSKIKSMFYTR